MSHNMKGGKEQESIQSSTPLTQDTTWESDKNTIKHHKRESRVSPFSAGDHNAAITWPKARLTQYTNSTNEPQKKSHL